MKNTPLVDVDSIVGSYAVRINDAPFHAELARRGVCFGPPVRAKGCDWTFVNATSQTFGIASKLRSNPDLVHAMMDEVKSKTMQDAAVPLNVSAKYGPHATAYILGCDPTLVEHTRSWMDKRLHVPDDDTKLDLGFESGEPVNQNDSYLILGGRLMVSVPIGRFCVEIPSPELPFHLHQRGIPFTVRSDVLYVRPLEDEIPFLNAGPALSSVWDDVWIHMQEQQTDYSRVSIVWDGFRERFNIVSNSSYVLMSSMEWLARRIERAAAEKHMHKLQHQSSKRSRSRSSDNMHRTNWLAKSVV